MKGVPASKDRRLLVGFTTGDDAGVFRVAEDMALVQTVDVFTPVVDDPFVFGQIVAANGLSDVWAMGGQALTALNLLGYPPQKMTPETATEIIRGIGERLKLAGAVLCGGHTWVDPELRVGLSVTGMVHPDRIVTNAGARPGDALMLTKPIGSGIMTLAAIQGKADPGLLASVIRSMVELNRTASEVMVETGVHACTDITGFSLIGHACEMASASRADMEIRTSQVPLFEGVSDLSKMGVKTPLGQKNISSFEPYTKIDKAIPPEIIEILFDPQTSGGLLISVEKEKSETLLKNLHREGILSSRIIGEVLPKEKGIVHITE
jgi:selenide,water dikinase